ncbi:MAG: SDR family NAD(P)-dependent oxidoreductase [Candidatus Tectomicrobia bacterium]|uniref:SDR family NAD(P)-dependent oxidoreductase n=1 Tax=Tectimicrobiota bacterium TaxID=2528274 RepID=A0A932MKG5_UNCTE|nr:SDR family NAD(P)-dependent oxidoreductase [Candidatus Tectomicrobia bacterium]
MSENGSTVLVTGAGGFIGSHVVEALVAEGRHVRAFVRYTGRQEIGALRFVPKETLEKIEIIQGDLRNFDSVMRAMKDARWVIHLGALISIPYSYVSPEETVLCNVVGTLNVLQAARTAGVERVVHTSSSEVYGTARYVPMDESHPLQGQSPYSASKIGADKLAESFHRSFGVPVVTIRPFNVFGPRQSTRAVIPTIITQILRGKDLHLGSLHPTRDFTYVDDTASAFLMAATVPSILGRKINVGNGQEVSIGDLVSLIAELMGKEVRVVQDAERIRPGASEVERLYADSSLARNLLGWEPKIGLEEGLRKTIDWVSRNVNFYQSEEYAR